MISVYETPGMGLVGKKSFKVCSIFYFFRGRILKIFYIDSRCSIIRLVPRRPFPSLLDPRKRKYPSPSNRHKNPQSRDNPNQKFIQCHRLQTLLAIRWRLSPGSS